MNLTQLICCVSADCWVGKASFAMEYPQRINEKSLDILDEGAKLMPVSFFCTQCVSFITAYPCIFVG